METKSYCIVVTSDNRKLANSIPITWLKLEIGDPVPVIGQIYEWYRPFSNTKSKSEKYVQVDTHWMTNFGRLLAIESNYTLDIMNNWLFCNISYINLKLFLILVKI